MLRFVKEIQGSRDSDNYSTPPDFYEELNKEFKFDFDPCPLKPTQDGLQVDWVGNIFINPPYSNIKAWVEKGLYEMERGTAKTLVYLLPCRTDTKYFHELIYHRAELRFVKGRLKFSGKAPAPFPVYLAIFR